MTAGLLALAGPVASQGGGTCSGLISTNPYPPVAGEQVNVCSQPLPGAPVTGFNWDIDGSPGVDVSTTEPGVPWTFTAVGDVPVSVEVTRADGTRAHYRSTVRVVTSRAPVTGGSPPRPPKSLEVEPRIVARDLVLEVGEPLRFTYEVINLNDAAVDGTIVLNVSSPLLEIDPACAREGDSLRYVCRLGPIEARSTRALAASVATSQPATFRTASGPVAGNARPRVAEVHILPPPVVRRTFNFEYPFEFGGPSFEGSAVPDGGSRVRFSLPGQSGFSRAWGRQLPFGSKLGSSYSQGAAASLRHAIDEAGTRATGFARGTFTVHQTGARRPVLELRPAGPPRCQRFVIVRAGPRVRVRTRFGLISTRGAATARFGVTDFCFRTTVSVLAGSIVVKDRRGGGATRVLRAGRALVIPRSGKPRVTASGAPRRPSSRPRATGADPAWRPPPTTSPCRPSCRDAALDRRMLGE